MSVLYLCGITCTHVQVPAEVRSGCLNALELDLQAIVNPRTWVLGTKLWSSASRVKFS